MIVLAGSHSSIEYQQWANCYGNVGNLFSERRTPALPYYALDNGKFTAWKDKKPWHIDKFLAMCNYYCNRSRIKPRWILLPDVVADREATIANWYLWEARFRAKYPGIPLAFAVQNGMQPQCVPDTADVIFVGGTFEWKWATMPMWCQSFPRVHVARVNSWQRLWYCQNAGAESCDGTGWFKGVEERHDLHLFLAIQAGKLLGVETLDLPRMQYKWRSQLLKRYLDGWTLWNCQEEPLLRRIKQL
ncbi:MAG: hypothetical protein F6K31_13220 [Symploca sp. SIO2G7]|nr:hypothetical protein [Symploca sp. SIO2G7]